MHMQLLKRSRSIWLVILAMGFALASSANDQDAVDFKAVLQLATFADAAYRSEAKVSEMLEPSGFKLTRYQTIPGIELAYFLATNEASKTQVIAVRGTANVENAMVDISLKLRVDPHSGVSLHEGFGYSAAQVYAELKPLLDDQYAIDLTGHSLGGAVAMILAMYLDIDNYPVNQVVTFGQPKVTNIPGAEKIAQLNLLRIVEPDDLVPLVPLFDPLDINNLDIYWHAGKEVVLLDDNRYAVLEGVSSMMRATKFTQKPLSEDNLRNHQMAAYRALVEARIGSSELVPYKTNLNLFNLFGSE